MHKNALRLLQIHEVLPIPPPHYQLLLSLTLAMNLMSLLFRSAKFCYRLVLIRTTVKQNIAGASGLVFKSSILLWEYEVSGSVSSQLVFADI